MCSPPCQGGGRGFKSRRDRKASPQARRHPLRPIPTPVLRYGGLRQQAGSNREPRLDRATYSEPPRDAQVDRGIGSPFIPDGWEGEGDQVRYWAKPRHRLREPDEPVHNATDEEVLPLLRACHSARDRLIIVCLAQAGLRRGELCGLHRQPVGAPMRPGALNELLAGLSRRARLERQVHPHMLRHILCAQFSCVMSRQRGFHEGICGLRSAV
jgi:hypothetical protein